MLKIFTQFVMHCDKALSWKSSPRMRLAEGQTELFLLEGCGISGMSILEEIEGAEKWKRHDDLLIFFMIALGIRTPSDGLRSPNLILVHGTQAWVNKVTFEIRTK